MAKNPKVALKQLMQQTPVITGFSYPFLRLLVDRLQELLGKSEGFYTDTGFGHSKISDLGQALINQIQDQLKGQQPLANTSGLSDGPWREVAEKEVAALLGTAEAFLATFELTEEDLRSL